MSTLFAIDLLGVLGLLWAWMFVREAIREKDVLERVLYAALGLPGLLAAAPALFFVAALIFAASGGAGFLVGLGVDIPVVSPLGWIYLAAVGALALVVVGRRLRARMRGRAE